MRFKVGVGHKVGPFWAGVTLSPRRHFQRYDTRENADLMDSTPFLLGCGFTIVALSGLLILVLWFFAFFL